MSKIVKYILLGLLLSTIYLNANAPSKNILLILKTNTTQDYYNPANLLNSTVASKKVSDTDNKVWKDIGVGFMNSPVNILIKNGIITAGIDIGGLIRSADLGKTWTSITKNSYGGINNNVFLDFDISPTDENIILIGTKGAIYRSDDNSTSYSIVSNDLPKHQFLINSTNYGQIKFNADGSSVFSALGSIWYLDKHIKLSQEAIDTYHPNKEIYVSNDKGLTFKTFTIENETYAPIQRIYPHPANKDIVYFSFSDGSFFVTLNSTSLDMKLIKITLPENYKVRDLKINPSNDNHLLLLLGSQNSNGSLLYQSNNATSTKFSITEVSTLPIREHKFISIGFQNQKIIIGEMDSNSYFVSDDNGLTFAKIKLSRDFGFNIFPDFYTNVENIYIDKDTNNSIFASRVGLWLSEDNFNTFKNITLTKKDEWINNNGIGAMANINSISMNNKVTYYTTQDHGLWVTNELYSSQSKLLTGKDSWNKFPTQEVPWGTYTWAHQVDKVGSSRNNENIIFSVLKYTSTDSGFKKEKKFFRTKNNAQTWEDITSGFNLGDIYPAGNTLEKIIFNPNNSNEIWVLFNDKIYHSINGGDNFNELSSANLPDFAGMNFKYSDVVFDRTKNILYLSVGNIDSEFHKVLNNDTKPATLYRSFDNGNTFEIYDIGQYSVQSIGTTEDSDLIVSTSKVDTYPALLLKVPFNYVGFNENHIKLTYGDTLDEIKTCGLKITPIKIDGENILAYANANWLNSDLKMAQGPYLSTDSGENWKFIKSNLAQSTIYSADIKNEKILLGTTLGLMEYDLNIFNTVIYDEFNDFNNSIWDKSDWANGDPFLNAWCPSQINFNDGYLSLSLIEQDCNSKNFSSGEYRTREYYKYGRYSTEFKSSDINGTISSFFIYTGAADGTDWDEIDIEILGKDPTKIQINYWRNGHEHPVLIDLGFDSSRAMHKYSFIWHVDYIKWYVDDKLIYRVEENHNNDNDSLPINPGKIMLNLWAATGINNWSGSYENNSSQVFYNYVKYEEEKTDIQQGTPPEVPENVVATAVSSSEISLEWSDVTDEYGYHIKRWNGSDWVEIITVGSGTSAYRDSGLSPETSYRYKISAYNGSGSTDSSEASATTLEGSIQIALTANGYEEKSKRKADLVWNNATGNNVDIYRDETKLKTVPNNGSYTDIIGKKVKGKSSYCYQICEEGSTTNCSNEAAANF